VDAVSAFIPEGTSILDGIVGRDEDVRKRKVTTVSYYRAVILDGDSDRN